MPGPFTEPSPTLWVCTDCYMTHHGAREDDESVPDREPLGLLVGDLEITSGLLWSEHDDGCTNRAAEQWVDDCGCERLGFSWAWCPGCGSHLGGERHALTAWYRKEVAV